MKMSSRKEVEKYQVWSLEGTCSLKIMLKTSVAGGFHFFHNEGGSVSVRVQRLQRDRTNRIHTDAKGEIYRRKNCEKSHNIPQAGEPGEPVVQLSAWGCVWGGGGEAGAGGQWRRRGGSAGISPRVQRPETRSSNVWGQRRWKSQLKEGKQIWPSSAFWFYLDLQGTGWCPPTVVRADLLYLVYAFKCQSLLQTPSRHTREIMFYQLSGHPAAQSSWHTKLAIISLWERKWYEQTCIY